MQRCAEGVCWGVTAVLQRKPQRLSTHTMEACENLPPGDGCAAPAAAPAERACAPAPAAPPDARVAELTRQLEAAVQRRVESQGRERALQFDGFEWAEQEADFIRFITELMRETAEV